MQLLLKRGEFLADDPNGHYVTNKIRIPAGGITIMRMKVIICDDEKAFCSSIRQQIECWATGRGHEKEVFVSEFHSSEDLLASLEAGEECQILFLDIEIPAEMSGMEAAKEIYSHNPYLPIVFVTNYSNYACEGYEVNALRYLVKPVTQSAIDQCLDIAWKKAELTLDKSIIVRDGNSVIALPLVDFVCAESARHNLIISTTENVQYSERKKAVPVSARNAIQPDFAMSQKLRREHDARQKADIGLGDNDKWNDYTYQFPIRRFIL